MIVRDCLGREREPSHIWPDGSYNCPFCCAAVMAERGGCPNPACFARCNFLRPDSGLDYPINQAREVLAEAERRAAEQRERDELNAWRQQYAAEQATERAQAEADVATAGYCVRCWRSSGGRKRVRHRAATVCRR